MMILVTRRRLLVLKSSGTSLGDSIGALSYINAVPANVRRLYKTNRAGFRELMCAVSGALSAGRRDTRRYVIEETAELNSSMPNLEVSYAPNFNVDGSIPPTPHWRIIQSQPFTGNTRDKQILSLPEIAFTQAAFSGITSAA